MPRSATDRHSESAPLAMTSDVWFTLLYLAPADQRRLEAGRGRVWANELCRSGASLSSARRAVRRLSERTARDELRGRTPSIEAQAQWLSREAGHRLSGPEIAEVLDRLLLRSPVRLAPGVRPALARLKRRGVRLGLVSNVMHETGAAVRALLARSGLAPSFSSVILSCEHPWAKPRPEPFWAALDQLRADPSEAVHLGDLRLDVLGARRAGVRPLLYTGLHRFEPGRLRRLTQLGPGEVERVARWRDVPSALRL